MWDRNDKSYWTYGFCVHNLSTLTLNTNVSNCIYVCIYIYVQAIFQIRLLYLWWLQVLRGSCNYDTRCLTTWWVHWCESIWIKYLQNKHLYSWKIGGVSLKCTFNLTVKWLCTVRIRSSVPVRLLYVGFLWCGIPCNSVMSSCDTT
jgi:hypothetical protein